MTTYFINEAGIYETRNVYHDDIEYVYCVEFNKPDTQQQFNTFLSKVRKEGGDQRIRDIHQLLNIKS